MLTDTLLINRLSLQYYFTYNELGLTSLYPSQEFDSPGKVISLSNLLRFIPFQDMTNRYFEPVSSVDIRYEQ